MPVGTSVADVGAGVHATTAIGFALFHRERTGEGQHLDISMVDSLFHMHEIGIQGPPLTGMRWTPKRSGHRSALNAPLGAFEGPEGWIVVQVMERQWPGFCRAMGRPDLETDDRFATMRDRQKNRDELNALIEEWTRSFATDDDLIATLEAERVPCAKVLAPTDAIGHPHFESRRAILRVRDPILDEVVIPASPLRFSAQPEPLDLVAPLLGEHNGEVLTELGYDDDAINGLIASGVVTSGDR
jgi:CoA:oxalate CoA-transferase